MDLFDPETLADLKYRAKKQLRSRMRGLRAAYPESVLAQASERIVRSVLALPQFSAAQGVGLFWPMADRREVDVRPLAAAALAADKRVYFPFLEPTANGFRTGFAEVRDVCELAERGQRFFEPPPLAPRAERGQMELLIVPALAASADGHRLGYGSGFYDATLPDFLSAGARAGGGVRLSVAGRASGHRQRRRQPVHRHRSQGFRAVVEARRAPIESQRRTRALAWQSAHTPYISCLCARTKKPCRLAIFACSSSIASSSNSVILPHSIQIR